MTKIKHGFLAVVCIALLCSCSNQTEANEVRAFYKKCPGKVTATIEVGTWNKSLKVTCENAQWYE